MNDVANYAQITTVAVVILVAMQVVFLIVVVAVGIRIFAILKRINQTTKMSKEFVSALREQQMKSSSLMKLGIFAFKTAKGMKR